MSQPPPIEKQITFLYTNDLTTSAQFYEDKLGLELWLDQGSCRIYSVIFTLVTQQVDEWYEYLKKLGVEFEKPPTFNEKYKIYHCFLHDPNGYLIEIQRFN
jgi:catechol 2,3-dioxygenase-like lactoylglutathione lyase family enzyme